MAFKLFILLECKYNKLQSHIRVNSIVISKQTLCHSYFSNSIYSKEILPGVPSFSRVKGFRVVLGKQRYLYSFPQQKSFQKQQQGLEETVNDGRGIEETVNDGRGIEETVNGGRGLEQTVNDGRGLEETVNGGRGLEETVNDGRGLEETVNGGCGLEETVNGGRGLEETVNGGSCNLQPFFIFIARPIKPEDIFLNIF